MKFKFPTFASMYKSLKATFVRFPFTVVTALLITITVFWGIENTEELTLVGAILAASFLAYVVYTAFSLLRERHNLSSMRFIMYGGVIAVAAVLYGYFLNTEHLPDRELYRYALYFASAFLLLLLSVFHKKKDDLKLFWSFNMESARRFIRTAIIGAAMFIGISLALLAIEVLFFASIEEELYMRLWILVVALFGTFYFLAGIPVVKQVKYTELKKTDSVIIKYILLPLVAVYFLILYAYTGEILLKGELPEGIMAYLISGFSAVGLLAYIILYPLKEKKNWVYWYEKIFFIALIPQTFMLFWAFHERFLQYGFTERRYYLMLFGVWLLLQAGYYLFSKRKDLRFIFASLIVILIVSTVGPWSAFSISKKSQLSRFVEEATKQGLLVDGQIVNQDEPLTYDQIHEIESIIQYLVATHGPKSLSEYFGEVKVNQWGYLSSSDIQLLFGVPFDLVDTWSPIHGVQKATGIKNLYFDNYDFKNFSYELPAYNELYAFKSAVCLGVDSDCDLRLGTFSDDIGNPTKILVRNESELHVERGEGRKFIVDLNDFIKTLDQGAYNPAIFESMVYEYEDDEIVLSLIVGTMTARIINDHATIDSMNGILLFTEK